MSTTRRNPPGLTTKDRRNPAAKPATSATQSQPPPNKSPKTSCTASSIPISVKARRRFAPTSASFVWAPGACADVTLEISFANFKLTRHWTGDRAFVDFLRLFNGGQHTFGVDDFPSQRNLMGSENLIGIQLTYRQEGEQVLMDKYSQADQLQRQAVVIDAQLNGIAEQ